MAIDLPETKFDMTVDLINNVAGVVSTLRKGAGGEYVRAAKMLQGIGDGFTQRQNNADALQAQRDVAQGAINDKLYNESNAYKSFVSNNRFQQTFLGIHQKFANGEFDSKSPDEVNNMMADTYKKLSNDTNDPIVMNNLTRNFQENQMKILALHNKRHLAWTRKEWVREGGIALNQMLEGATKGLNSVPGTLDDLYAVIPNVPKELREKTIIDSALSSVMNSNFHGVDILEMLPPTSAVLKAREQAIITRDRIIADNNAAVMAEQDTLFAEAAAAGNFAIRDVAAAEQRLGLPPNSLMSKGRMSSLYRQSRKVKHNNMMIQRGAAALFSNGAVPGNMTAKQFKSAMTLNIDRIVQTTTDPQARAGKFGRLIEQYPDVAAPLIRKHFDGALGFTGHFNASSAGRVPQERIDAIEAALPMVQYGNSVNVSKVFGEHAHMIRFVNDYLAGANGTTEQAVRAWEEYKKNPIKVDNGFMQDMQKHLEDQLENHYSGGFVNKIKQVFGGGEDEVNTRLVSSEVMRQAKVLAMTTPGVTAKSAVDIVMDRVVGSTEVIDGTVYKRTGNQTLQGRMHDAGFPRTMKLKDITDYFDDKLEVWNNKTGEYSKASDLKWVKSGDKIALADEHGNSIAYSAKDLKMYYDAMHFVDKQYAAADKQFKVAADNLALRDVLVDRRDKLDNFFNQYGGRLGEHGTRADNFMFGDDENFQLYRDVEATLQEGGILTGTLTEEKWNALGAEKKIEVMHHAGSKLKLRAATWFEKMKNTSKMVFNSAAALSKGKKDDAYNYMMRNYNPFYSGEKLKTTSARPEGNFIDPSSPEAIPNPNPTGP